MTESQQHNSGVTGVRSNLDVNLIFIWGKRYQVIENIIGLTLRSSKGVSLWKCFKDLGQPQKDNFYLYSVIFQITGNNVKSLRSLI